MGTVSYIGKQKLAQPYTSIVSANGSLPGVEGPWLSHMKKSQGNEERQPGIFQPLTKPHNIVSAHGSLQGFEVLGLPHSKISQGFEDQKWFYCLPYRCEYEVPVRDTGLKEKLSIPSKCEMEVTSNIVPGSVQKRFLVFDQSSNRTNLIMGSSVASTAQNPTLVNAVQIDARGSQQKDLKTDRDLITQPWTVISDGLSENKETCEESEMHEDSEELDALLYSDDSDSEDEETSTAHSPNEITGWKNQEEAAESPDEVTSPNGATKRKRLSDEEDEPSLLRDTASSLKFSKCDNDAESSYVKGRTIVKSHFSEANKRLKREKIWDTVNTLQNILPGGHGKDTVLILDEAIRYLRFLKVKAKYLGVDME
ncbi:Transcription factor bhlh [Thalictrum thalictroides]|uniref:Transcription factor bhlh n=1 Tax=Thalictrum thalictroides TaxID=46969 RepID=A0A7J6VM06_THATH|nr:Transcription factor bhlh [Thalictrum thalictroides]